MAPMNNTIVMLSDPNDPFAILSLPIVILSEAKNLAACIRTER